MLKPQSSVGVDAKTISFDDASKFREVLKKHDINLELIHENLVDIIWTDRPKVDLHEIFLLPAKYSGRESSEKIASLRSYLSENGLFGFVVTALDEVACNCIPGRAPLTGRAVQPTRLGYSVQSNVLLLRLCN